MNRFDGGRQVRKRERPMQENDFSVEDLAAEQRPTRAILARRILVNALLVIVVAAVAAVASVTLLSQPGTLQFSPGKGGNFKGDKPPSYEFTWNANAPGSLTAEQAYAAEAEVESTSDGSDTSPVASLWVAQSADAALVIAQLDPQGRWLTVVALARSREGSSAVWEPGGGDWPKAVYCTNESALTDGTCSESKLASPDDARLSELWSWSAPWSTLGVAARFLEPLTTGPSGGTLAGLTLSVGSVQEADGSTVVAVGTASAAQVQQRAAGFAAEG